MLINWLLVDTVKNGLATIVGDSSVIQWHVSLKGSRIAPLSNRICLFFKCDCLMNKLFSTWQCTLASRQFARPTVANCSPTSRGDFSALYVPKLTSERSTFCVRQYVYDFVKEQQPYWYRSG